MKKKIFIISYEIYPFDVLVAIGATDKEVNNYLHKFGIDLTEEETTAIEMEGKGRTSILEGGQTILRLRSLKNTPFDYGILAHECFHAVEFLFNRIGVEHDVHKSGEAYAYTVQYLVENIIKEIRS